METKWALRGMPKQSLALTGYSKQTSFSQCLQVPSKSSLGQDPSVANKKLGFHNGPEKELLVLCLYRQQRSTVTAKRTSSLTGEPET